MTLDRSSNFQDFYDAVSLYQGVELDDNDLVPFLEFYAEESQNYQRAAYEIRSEIPDSDKWVCTQGSRITLSERKIKMSM